MATTAEIANDLVSLCGQGKFWEVIEKHYSPKIVSVEPMPGTPEMPNPMEGIEAVQGKNKWWADNHEVHAVRIDGPFVGDDQFACRMWLDVTAKHMGNARIQMEEMCLYTVKDGKIVREEFYYYMPPPPSA
ncbi:MAG: nuclear transport factor 2 family protein [Acidobacteria bacterium]|nr:nuclear transport factor 2 family protein [Acidobacteriota bacterium]